MSVFARLLCKKENLPNVVGFLSQHTCLDGGNGLHVLLTSWLDNHEHFSPPYLMKLSVVALSNFLELCLSNPALASLEVDGDVIETKERTTRSISRRRGAEGLSK